MSWNLFIDDERWPLEVSWWPAELKTRTWTVARNIGEVRDLIGWMGMPSYISFDHDLGEFTANGYEIMRGLVEDDMDGVEGRRFPTGFDFYVHSMNPVGKVNIETYLNNYLRVSRGG